jgi:hypothetical protein
MYTVRPSLTWLLDKPFLVRISVARAESLAKSTAPDPEAEDWRRGLELVVTEV